MHMPVCTHMRPRTHARTHTHTHTPTIFCLWKKTIIIPCTYSHRLDDNTPGRPAREITASAGVNLSFFLQRDNKKLKHGRNKHNGHPQGKNLLSLILGSSILHILRLALLKTPSRTTRTIRKETSYPFWMARWVGGLLQLGGLMLNRVKLRIVANPRLKLG